MAEAGSFWIWDSVGPIERLKLKNKLKYFLNYLEYV